MFGSFWKFLVDSSISDLLDLCLCVDGVLYLPLEASLPCIINFIASLICLGMFLCVVFGDIVFPCLSWLIKKVRLKYFQKT